MNANLENPTRPFLLGIEGGGTHTVAILADVGGQLIQRFEAGAANLRLLDEAQLAALLKSIAAVFPAPDALGIGLAGARSEADWERIRVAAGKSWPGIPCHATSDLETALAAGVEKPGASAAARVLVLSGTGSCCYGRSATGQTAKIGGWGHILGDKGSGYEIGLRALKSLVYHFDRDGVWPQLGQQILHRLELNEPNELLAWVQSADKSQIASLAAEVFLAWSKGDRIAACVIDRAELSLAEDAVECARKIAAPRSPVQFILTGGILLKQPRFAKAIARRIKKAWPGAVVSSLERESAWGAVNLAGKVWRQAGQRQIAPAKASRARKNASPRQPKEMPLSQLAQLSPTEQRHPLSRNLDKLPVSKAIQLMLSEDAKIPAAIQAEGKNIETAVGFITRAFRSGGRLFYVGAGTSGRLGILDASECPPTFRSDPEMVQGIIAGGQAAIWRAVEGAEDDAAAGARAIAFRNVTRRDVVVGIAASGRTPFVWGALGEAKRRGAKTVLLAFNPFLAIPAGARPALVITPNVGPELLTGSTRLKSGTATKLVLNIFTTLAMVGIGKVVGNLMVDLNPSNVKLRDRATRIIQELRGVDYATAKQALEESHWVIKKALGRLSAKKR